jgi:hypothetical protein
VPAAVAGMFFRRHWQIAFGWMMATMLVDLDHLLASPIYDPARCSIGFHPLHSVVPIGVYCLLVIFPKTRYLGLGLVIHMLLDALDCQMNLGIWFV